VCINQDGILEKNHQVAVMDQIYERAEEVLVWLGDTLKSDCLALWTIKQLSEMEDEGGSMEALNRNLKDFSQMFYSSTDCTRELKCSHCGSYFEMSPQGALDASHSFWSRPWFSRLWIIQEVFVARKVTFFFGEHVAAYEMVEAGSLRWMTFLVHRHEMLRPESFEVDAQTHWIWIMDYLRSIPVKYHCQDLVRTLINTRACASSNAHDRVFAVRRLAQVHRIDALLSDYSIPIADLWKRVAMVELLYDTPWSFEPDGDHACPLLILALSGLQQRSTTEGSPSWVPDFGNLNEECQRKCSSYQINSFDKWAGGKGNIRVMVTEEMNVLEVEGKIVGRIDHICPDSSYSPIFDPDLRLDARDEYRHRMYQSIISWYAKCFQFISLKLAASRPLGRSLRLLLQHGIYEDKKDGPSYEEFLAAFNLWKISNELAVDCQIDPSAMYEDLNAYLAHFKYTPQYVDRSRILATTKDGRAGWVPATTKPDDFATVFQGSPYPCILRARQDGYYTVIGDAYIQGIMQGEAWPAHTVGVSIRMK
jgi:hypothetical protein